MTKRKESDLSKPVAEWMRKRGWTVYAEVPSGDGYHTVDLVGRQKRTYQDDPDIMVVELKLSLTDTVIYQAKQSRYFTADTWVAVGTRPNQSSLQKAKDAGVGVLSVHDDGSVSTIHWPRNYEAAAPDYVKRFHNYLDHMPEGDVGGLRNHAPARECYARFKKWVGENGRKTWKEMYESIPNHYACANSFAMQMRDAEKRDKDK